MKEELDWQPSAISNEEKHFLEEFARDTYSGFGEIVDLGCWMGSSTVSLAKGLSENKSSQTQNKKVHAYDWFRWATWMEEAVKGTDFENKYQTDDSFFEDFKTFARPWSNRIIIYSEDLTKAQWIGENIELLSIDAMKDWELVKNILKTFFAYLQPGKSFIFHQDFAHWWTSWIHIAHFRLREYFKLVYDIPNSQALVFQCIEKIPEELLRQEYSSASLSEVEIEQAFDYSMSLTTDKQKQAAIASAKVMMFIHRDDPVRAQIELDQFLSAGFPLTNDLASTAEWISWYHS